MSHQLTNTLEAPWALLVRQARIACVYDACMSMQSPRSPLDWEWESQDSDPDTSGQGVPAQHDAAVLSTLQALQAEVATLGRDLRLNGKAVSKHARRGLLGGLLHALDIILLGVAEAFLDSPSLRLW